MRILLCCADWGVPLGGHAGSSVHVRAMARALADLGHAVRLVVSNATGPVTLDRPVQAVPYRCFWPAGHGFCERLRGRAPGEAATMPAPVATESAGAACGDTAGPGPTPAESWKVRLYYRHLPRVADAVEELVWHRRRFARAVDRAVREFRPHGVYERYALGQTGTARALRRLGPGAPAHLLEVNASLADERALRGELPGPLAWLARMEEARLWRRADRVFCVSEALWERAVLAGVSPDRVEVAPNGVDLVAFSPDRPRGSLRRLLGAGEADILVGFVGSLSPGRGGGEFLGIMARALPLVPAARGVVIGDGPLAGELRRLAVGLGLEDRVVFVGAVDHERVPSLLVDLDVALACYPKQDGFYFSPMKVLEYMACGLPVVCGRAGQMQQLVEDDCSGVLVEPGDMAAWSRAVVEVCRNPHRRARLGQAARRKALAGPTWEKNAGRVAATLEALARPGRRNLP